MYIVYLKTTTYIKNDNQIHLFLRFVYNLLMCFKIDSLKSRNIHCTYEIFKKG